MIARILYTELISCLISVPSRGIIKSKLTIRASGNQIIF